MTVDLIYDVVSLVLTLIQTAQNKPGITTATTADTLLQIAQKSAQAYLLETGTPLDPTLLKVEPTI